MTKRKALGKGLAALIPEVNGLETGGQDFFQCPIEAIEPNPYQPRKEFGDTELDDLVSSVKEKGIITPILVSKEGSGYRLIAGERRWRAAQRAGLKRVPVVVRETTPMESLELALIENIHRKDLNPIEEALAYQKWLEDSDTTQEILSKRVGRERSTITNMLRLLKLPRLIQQDLVDGRMTTGHARVLAGIRNEEEQKRVRALILRNELSVRQTEALLKRKGATSGSKRKENDKDLYYQSLAEEIKRSIGARVVLRRKGRTGSITIHFSSDEELERLLDLLT